MTPERLVASREACERLKKAGFPQATHFGWAWNPTGDSARVTNYYDQIRPDAAGLIAAAPTLEEVLEELRKAVPTTLFHVSAFDRGWSIADDLGGIGTPSGSGATAVEAAALLLCEVMEGKA